MKFHVLTVLTALFVALCAAPAAYASITAVVDQPMKKAAPGAEDPGPSPQDEAEESEDNMPDIQGAPGDEHYDKDTMGEEE